MPPDLKAVKRQGAWVALLVCVDNLKGGPLEQRWHRFQHRFRPRGLVGGVKIALFEGY